MFRERRSGSGRLEGSSELRSRVDVELAEDAPEVRLDGVLGQEQGLCDLPVCHSVGGEASDAELGGCEIAAALDRVTARPGARCDQLVMGARGNRVRAAGTGECECFAEWLACICALAGASRRRAELEQRERMFEPPRRELELGD